MTHPRDFGLTDPDDVGASEYRAVYELLATALEGYEDDDESSPGGFALVVLDEVIAHASEMRALIVAAGCATTA